YTLGNYLANTNLEKVDEGHDAFRCAAEQVRQRVQKLLSINGKRSPDAFHRELGQMMWHDCGMERTAEGLKKALEKIPQLRAEFWENVRVLGSDQEINQSLELAGRVADFLELAELIVIDAL